MNTELFNDVRDATEGQFELLGELDGGPGWMAYLARETGRGALSVLVLEEASAAGGAQFDLEAVGELDATLAIGVTRCPACHAEADGWPRSCEACGRDLSGEGGASTESLLDAVRESAAGSFEVLGAMRHREGGGAVYFARSLADGRIVGLRLERDSGDELELVQSWTPDEAALAGQSDPPTERPRDVRHPPPFSEDDPERGDGWAAETAGDPEPPRAFSEPVPPFPEAPPRRSGRRRRGDGDRRLLLTGVAVAGLILVGTVAYAMAHRQADGRDAVNPVSDTSGQPTDSIDGDRPLAQVDSSLTPSPPIDRPDPQPHPPQPRPEPDRPAPQPVPTPPPVVPPPVEPEPAVAVADDEVVLGAVNRYVAAIESRSVARIRSAYPGISSSEVAWWEGFFGDVPRGGVLRATLTVDDPPAITGDASRMLFTVSLTYRDAAGRPVRQLLPLRAALRRVPGGWRLDQVRVIG